MRPRERHPDTHPLTRAGAPRWQQAIPRSRSRAISSTTQNSATPRPARRSPTSGRLKQRSYETREGEKRTVYEIEVDDVGPSMRNASAKVTKSNRSGGGGGFGGGGQGGAQRGQGGSGGYGGSSGGRAAEDPWASSEPGGFGDGGSSDEPPF